MHTLPFLRQNLEAMGKAGQSAAFWLAACKPDPEVVASRVGQGPAGLLDWTLENGETLFSKVHPGGCYGSWLRLDKPAPAATVAVGSNLGYGINELLSKTPPGHKVLVVEPDPDMLLACLGQTEYAPFIESGRLQFLAPDPQPLFDAMKLLDVEFFFGRIYLRLDLPSRQMSSVYAQTHRMCQNVLENISVELATLRNRQDAMVSNELDNYTLAMTDGGVGSLESSAKGLTAVILGAGPSLAATGPQLAQDPGYALYVSAFQTLPALQHVGLKPHFCMSIDFNDTLRSVYNRLDPVWAADVPLVYSTKTDPEVVRRYPGPRLPVWTLGGLGTYVFKDVEPVLDAGGNVSVALFRLLRWSGVDRMLFAGQDFAWLGGQTHVAGHHTSDSPIDQSQLTIVKLQNADGEEITSAQSFTTALRDLEKDIAGSEVEAYNIYGGGAVIQGAANVDMETVRKQGLLASAPGRLEAFERAMEVCRTPRPVPVFEPRGPQWSVSLRKVSKRLDKLFKKPKKNQEEIGKTFSEVHIFMRQDPLYVPYLYNQIMDVAGLTRKAGVYTPADMSAFSRIVKATMSKVRRMDETLCMQRPEQHEQRAAV